MVDETTYLVALHSVPGMRQETLQHLIERYGTAERVVTQCTQQDMAAIRGMNDATRLGVLNSRNRMTWAERICNQMKRAGARLITEGSENYPRRLTRLFSPPRLLYVVGDMETLKPPNAAIVGSSNPSKRGLEIAGAIAVRLVKCGATIVSGMANGIDLAAHQAAITAGGKTVFVLPTGILRYHPGPLIREPHDTWADRAAAVCECPPEAEWSASAAVARNRIIAALASVVVLIETEPDGGAMHTVHAAQELLRPVFAVRYKEPAPSATGNEVAISKGATPLAKLSEVHRVIEAALSCEGA